MATQKIPMMFANWEDSVSFGDKGPSMTTLIETQHLKALLVGLRADQTIPMHPSPEAIYHFLKGSGTMMVDDESYEVAPGVTVVVPDGSQRGVIADSDIVFIGATIPTNAEASNAR